MEVITIDLESRSNLLGAIIAHSGESLVMNGIRNGLEWWSA